MNEPLSAVAFSLTHLKVRNKNNTQSAFPCSELTIETPEQCVKSVQR